MVQGNPITKTKKFLRNTIQSFKSLFLSGGGGGYERLPKSPPSNPFSCAGEDSIITHQSFRELDKFYTDFTKQWDSNQDKARKKNKKTAMATKEPMKEGDVYINGSFMKFVKQSTPAKSKNEDRRKDNEKRSIIRANGGRKQGQSCSSGVRERGSYLMAQKLRELEMMDVNDVDHALDIEEVIHYYSRLTCPAYLDIVDKFFMEMYSELFTPLS
ncbi:PREDICTED: uncharacterized protein LOC104592209 [Nelumbo nucifera]|uniref:OVATE domain-containing protein n=2 Tax=Nelumbo nucifera TaxID=4432 RepID=A0A822ZMI6_NELNU|nr:PREDICTED: uncharacterized protein LOC104592209 [Nelumbo nucifera]DAD44685.1 TPA_asm: hypothetical protein HUJ06_002915 [Nelumbo nucifera]